MVTTPLFLTRGAGSIPDQEIKIPHAALLVLLLSRFSRVRLCATLQTAAHRLLRPWDSPGKNTGVGCHCLLQCTKVKSESEVTPSCLTLSDPILLQTLKILPLE